MTRKIVFFVDCDNQHAIRAKSLLSLASEKIGDVSCVFLVGNNHGKSVKAWRDEVRSHCPSVLVDYLVTSSNKESADTELIGKMFAFKSLFSAASVDVLVLSRDMNIVAAGKMLESAGFTVHYDIRGDSDPDFWLEKLEIACKIFKLGEKRYLKIADAGSVMAENGMDRLDRTRVLEAMVKSKKVVLSKKSGRLYLSGAKT